MKHGRTLRREGALERLEAQLASGTKNSRDGEVKLSEVDVKRINKEIDNLKTNLKRGSLV